MAYNISKYDGNPLVTVPDGTIDTTTTSLSLIGKNASNSGLPINENFVALLQNFASSSPPASPIVGQIWYDSVSSSIKVWDGLIWILISPPFDGNAGTSPVKINNSLEVLAIFSAGHIVAIISHDKLSPAQLIPEVEVAGVNYQFKSRFPYGVMPGITLAIDPNGYIFNGIASTAMSLLNERTIELAGSVTGSVKFNGSSNVVMNTLLPTVFNSEVNTSTLWSKVLVNSNGLVTDATVINSTDIITGLGYTPPTQVVLTGNVTGNSAANGAVFFVDTNISNTGVTPGTYNTVTVTADGRVVSGSTDNPVPAQGIIMFPNTAAIPSGWVVCNGQTIVTPTATYNTPNLQPNFIGSTIFIMRVV